MLKLNKKRDFRCKECGMHFDDAVRLERHFKAAHPPKHDGFRPKWYWETWSISSGYSCTNDTERSFYSRL